MPSMCQWKWNGYSWERVVECEQGHDCLPPENEGEFVDQEAETPCKPSGSASV